MLPASCQCRTQVFLLRTAFGHIVQMMVIALRVWQNSVGFGAVGVSMRGAQKNFRSHRRRHFNRQRR